MNDQDKKLFMSTASGVVLQIWEEVSGTVKDLLETDKSYGFALIDFAESPSLDQLDVAAAVLQTIVDKLSSMQQHSSYADTSKLLNCKQQIVSIRLVIEAAKAGDEECYTTYISRLRSQAPM